MKTKSIGFVLSVLVLFFTISCGKLKERLVAIKEKSEKSASSKNEKSETEVNTEYENKPIKEPASPVIFSLTDLQFYNRYISNYNSLFESVQFAENEYIRIIPEPKELADDPLILVNDQTASMMLKHKIGELEKNNNSDDFKADDVLMQTNFQNGFSNLLNSAKLYLSAFEFAFSYYKDERYKEEASLAPGLNEKVTKKFEEFNKQAKEFGRLIDSYSPEKINASKKGNFSVLVNTYNNILNESAIILEVTKNYEPNSKKIDLNAHLNLFKDKYATFKERIIDYSRDEPLLLSDFESIFNLVFESYINAVEGLANYHGSEEYTVKRLKNDIELKYVEVINAYNTCASGMQATGVKVKY